MTRVGLAEFSPSHQWSLLPSAERRPGFSAFPQLLHALPQLVLEAEVFCPLHRRHELSELALLGCDEVNALPLKPDQLVEKITDLLLIGAVSSHQLGAQSLPRPPFIRDEGNSLTVELLIDQLKARHLIGVEPELAANDLRAPLPESSFQQCALFADCGSARSARADTTANDLRINRPYRQQCERQRGENAASGITLH